MIQSILNYLTITIFVSSLWGIADRAQAELGAKEIVSRVIEQSKRKYFSANVTMQLIDGSGKNRLRKFTLRSLDQGDYRASLSNFSSPSDVKNTGFLSVNLDKDEQKSGRWMFIPSVGKTKKIPKAESHKKFMASDFSYADLEPIKLERNKYRILKTAKLEGEAAWVIEVLPRDKAEAQRSGYKKSVLYVNQNRFTVLRSAHWLNDGKNVKLMRVLKEEKIDGKWLAKTVKMSSKNGKKTVHETIISFDDIDTQSPIASSFFTRRQLEKGH